MLRDQIVEYLAAQHGSRASWVQQMADEYLKLEPTHQTINPVTLDMAAHRIRWRDKVGSVPIVPPPSEPLESINYRALSWFDCVQNNQIEAFFKEIEYNFEYRYPSGECRKRMLHMTFVILQAFDQLNDETNSSLIFHDWMQHTISDDDYKRYMGNIVKNLKPYANTARLDEILQSLNPVSADRIDGMIAAIHPQGWQYVDRYRLELIELAEKQEGALVDVITAIEYLHHEHFSDLSCECPIDI
ncbi:hypothetical protein H6G00_01760 [Leptolyngbya sp. FACHB-541]|uniref:hypothetical protein n=1 Tax=Leptolyngbya sp. FACHB-541 TaxID=2692810 RepID=UPI001682AE9B|nr:hypothetical protein [Leptolyngbya sp. FACHB-541]MBD1995357.1 hypothetical protein [Leptolyngbya sp. FACHB-541]